MLILGWIVWAIAASIAVGFIFCMRGDAKKEQPIHILQVFQTVLMISIVTIFVLEPWNKLHLIWLLPASFVGAFLGFIVFRIPVVGTILRMITLGFARVFFIGTGANLRGVPDGK
jgi:hypothetical protein